MKKWTLPTTIFYLTALLIILLDQITKYIIRQTVPLSASFPIIPYVFSITHTTNTGASFSMFTEWSFLLGVIAVFVILSIFIFYKKIPKNYRFAFALILGGATGNLIDRIFFGAVTDFLHISIWPIFNIADMAITTAAVLLIYISWQEEKEEKIKSKEKKE